MKLKPCPFCGGEAELVIGSIVELWQHAVECKDCGANTGYKWGICPSVAEKKAIEAWNRREPIEKIVERLEEKATEADEGFSIYEDNYIGGEGNAFREAIEIVKKGGAV